MKFPMFMGSGCGDLPACKKSTGTRGYVSGVILDALTAAQMDNRGTFLDKIDRRSKHAIATALFSASCPSRTFVAASVSKQRQAEHVPHGEMRLAGNRVHAFMRRCL
jgi:hypothetical protein